ncbi:MAG: hypothetical protein GQ583_02340 [Methyloprofundus sp.]|nr:hypothetical protein [Methyloprofundus sp.]
MNESIQFPFAIDDAGITEKNNSLDKEIQGKIIQLLFTAPGERINKPEFGCGLLNLVFEPNDDILAAALEFTIGQALLRWLVDDIMVDGVDVESHDERVSVSIAYTIKKEYKKSAVRITFK